MITPEKITELKPNEIFVFGANILGAHGAGAAKQALKWGAEWGKIGLMGQTFGLPTKSTPSNTLPIDRIQLYVNRLEDTVKANPDKHFLVTKVGCGLAGYDVSEIAPLFVNFFNYPNVSLPKEFYDLRNA